MLLGKMTICPLAIFRTLHKRDLFLAIFSTITCSFWGFVHQQTTRSWSPFNVCRSLQFLHCGEQLNMAAF
jgi:hypothetical protein